MGTTSMSPRLPPMANPEAWPLSPPQACGRTETSLRIRPLSGRQVLAIVALVPLATLFVVGWLIWGQVQQQARQELSGTAGSAAEYAARLLDGQVLLADRVDDLLRDLPDDLATYKGFLVNKPMIVEYLSKFDDGAPTSPGIYPD